MEGVETGVPQRDEGAGAGKTLHTPDTDGTPATPATAATEPATAESPAAVTPQQLKQLRGQYFTVRHIPLTDCGHKMDVINEPRHRNCENCWWQWLNFHPQLVQTVDEAWCEHGKAFIIRLRGRHFAKMFGRYMASVRHFMEQEEKAKQACEILSTMGKEQNGNDRQAAGSEGAGGKEVLGTVTAVDQSGENQGSTVGRESAQ